MWQWARGLIVLGVAGWLLLTGQHPTRAGGPWFVAPNGNDSNTCLTPADACATIMAPFSKAGFSAGDTILAAMGTYTGTGDSIVTLNLTSTISGGWNADFTSQIGLSVLDGEGSRRAFTIHAAMATIDSVYLQNTQADDGGAIWNMGTLHLSDAVITHSVTSGSSQAGGAIWNAGTAVLVRTQISHNSAFTGGGIATYGNLEMDHVELRENGGYQGGAIAVLGGQAMIANTLFADNSASSGGGVYFTSGGWVTITHSTIQHNNAFSGGAFFQNSGSLQVNASALVDNNATYGGGISQVGGAAHLVNTTLNGNSGSFVGGGIYAQNSQVTLYNTTVSSNSSTNGGGVYNWGDTAVISVTNSILADNSSADCGGAVASGGYNLIGTTATCNFQATTGDLLNVDPHLGPPMGVTSTYRPLRADSAAIDAGAPAGCRDQSGQILSVDQRGAPRAGRCDIGAYEYVAPGPASTLLMLSGSPQRGSVHLPFARSLVTVVLDDLGSPVPGQTVAFESPATGASATFAATQAVTDTLITDQFGLATEATVRANAESGDYVITATTTSVITPALFSLTNVGWYMAPSGDDANDCHTPSAPCRTLNAIVTRPGFVDGDVVLVAAEVFTSTGGEALAISHSVWLSGGWQDNFTAQRSATIIDGEGVRRGLLVGAGIAVTLDHFVIQNGSATYGGGLQSSSPLTLINSVLRNNTGYLGGAVFNGDGQGYHGGTLTLINSTVSGNTAGRAGGGIYMYLGNVNLNNVTITGNRAIGDGSADSGGGGVSGTAFSGGGLMVMRNTVIAGNTAGFGPDCNAQFAAFVSQGYTLMGNTAGCSFSTSTGDLVNVAARLGPWEQGPYGFHRLFFDSPAINAGDPAGCRDAAGNLLSTDQRGRSRLNRCDIGAVEMQALETSAKTVNKSTIQAGGTVTYTIVLRNIATTAIDQVFVTDTLPAQLSYRPGTLSATSGSPAIAGLTITWIGTVNPAQPISITFGATVASLVPGNIPITNTALIQAGTYTVTRSTLVTPFHKTYLPSVAFNFCGSGFFDDFSNPASGWPVGEDAYVRVGYLQGRYRVLAKNPNYLYVFRSPACNNGNYSVEADAQWAEQSGDGYGLMFDASADLSQYYLFYVNTDYKVFSLLRRDPGGFTLVAPWTQTQSINGSLAANHLKVTRNGNQITLAINNTPVGTWTDWPIPGNYGTGVMVSPYDGTPNADGRFDNFRLTLLAGTRPGSPVAAASTQAPVRSQVLNVWLDHAERFAKPSRRPGPNDR